jgi:REP element-mobilizing transposase RayT
MNNGYTKSCSATYNLGYHIIWCPKYRRKVLVGEIAELPTLWTRSYYVEPFVYISEATIKKYIEAAAARTKKTNEVNNITVSD